MRNPRRAGIGYVLKRFPRLSETFILNEILALERLGVDVEIFSLLRPPPEARHGLLSELRARITYLPAFKKLADIEMAEGLDLRLCSLASSLPTNDHCFGPLFPGKTVEQVAALHLKASTLAVLANARGIDHFHAHFCSDATTVALLASKLAGIGYSFTAHARDIFHVYASPEADDAMRRIKVDAATFAVTVSDYNKKHLAGLAPTSADRIHRIYNGIDLNRFRPAPSAGDANLVVAVGRLIEKKGFSDLIDACRLMRDDGVRFRCKIVGDGPLREDLLAQVSALDLSGCVELVGVMRQEQLIPTLGEASVVVLPCLVSRSGDRDGLPTVLLEAMALGRPVVTTTVSGGPEIVAHGETGLLVEPQNAMALAASIEVLLGDPQAADKMGRAGRRRAERLFSLERNAGALAALFEETIDRDAYLVAV